MFTQQRQTFRSDQSTEVQLSIETTANTDLKNRDNSETTTKLIRQAISKW